MNEGRFVADIYVPSRDLVIECDGDYWHRHTGEFDKARDEFMRDHGYRVVRIKESCFKGNIAREKISEAVA